MRVSVCVSVLVNAGHLNAHGTFIECSGALVCIMRTGSLGGWRLSDLLMLKVPGLPVELSASSASLRQPSFGPRGHALKAASMWIRSQEPLLYVPFGWHEPFGGPLELLIPRLHRTDEHVYCPIKARDRKRAPAREPAGPSAGPSASTLLSVVVPGPQSASLTGQTGCRGPAVLT